MTQSLEAQIQRLADIEEIKQLKAKYCAACDNDHNPDEVIALFIDDGVWEATSNGRFEGKAAIRQFMSDLRGSGYIRNSAHQVFNPVIEVEGDAATGHWRLLMMYTSNEPDGSNKYNRIIGWYKEKYRRVNGEWKYESLFCQVEENAPYLIDTDASAGPAAE